LDSLFKILVTVNIKALQQSCSCRIAMGVVAIPVVGWGVALGIGIADYMSGDKFYNWVETQ
jgi:hypothetical protein